MGPHVARSGRIVWLALVLGLAWAGAPAQAEGPDAAVDGIVATLRAGPDGAVVDWRFTRPPSAPIGRIHASLNGRPLGAPDAPLAAFPGPGQRAALLVLADASVEGSAVLAADPLPAGVEARVVRFGAGPGADDLPDAVQRGIDSVADQAGDRHAVVVATDGFVRGPLPIETLAAKARSAGVVLVFALLRGSRLADVAALKRLAEATGGGIVAPGRSLAQALAQGVLSGAVLHFPVGAARRYVWERHATVTAAIDYGDRRLSLSTEAALAPAGFADTASLLWARARRRLPAFVGGMAVALMGVAAIRKWPHATS